MSKKYKLNLRPKAVIGAALFIAGLSSTAPSVCWGHGEDESSAEETSNDVHPLTGHHLMTHPFLVHMGLPDEPGESSLRVTQIERAGALGKGSDQAIHIEAGLAERLGIHLRNDAISGNAMGDADGMHEEHGTELMVMYSLIENLDKTRGVSFFGEVAWPTMKGDGPSVRGAAGLGGTYLFGDRVILDAIVHADPSTGDLEIEYEASVRCRLIRRFFAILENQGSFGGNGESKHYLMPAVKLALGKTPATVGLGVQFPTSKGREFDRQTLFQLEIGF